MEGKQNHYTNGKFANGVIPTSHPFHPVTLSYSNDVEQTVASEREKANESGVYLKGVTSPNNSLNGDGDVWTTFA